VQQPSTIPRTRDVPRNEFAKSLIAAAIANTVFIQSAQFGQSTDFYVISLPGGNSTTVPLWT